MASRTKSSSAKKKAQAAVETSQSIAEQTEAFLKSGGEIQEIKTGVSGQQSLKGPKHITLSHR